MSARLKEAQSGSTTFKAALTTLRNKSKIDIENISSDIFELKQEVKLLEKQRRQIRSLLLDLSYGLQEDCDRSAIRGKEIASSAQLELMEFEANSGDGVDGMRRNITPTIVKLTNDLPLSEDNSQRTGSLVSVVSARRRDIGTDNYFTGGRDSATIIGLSGQQDQHNRTIKKKLLVDKWLQQLQLHLNSDLGKAIKKGLEITDPHLLSPPSSSQACNPETPPVAPSGTQRVDPASNITKNVVPFEAGRQGSRKSNGEWGKMSSEEVRVFLAALECRSVWRKFQRTSAKYLSNSFQTAEAEWFHFIESKDQHQLTNQQLSPNGQILRNGITISLPNEGSIRHTFPLSRGSVRFQDEDILKPDEPESESKKIPRKYPSQEAILIHGVKCFQDWQIFQRICLNAVHFPTPFSLLTFFRYRQSPPTLSSLHPHNISLFKQVKLLVGHLFILFRIPMTRTNPPTTKRNSLLLRAQLPPPLYQSLRTVENQK